MATPITETSQSYSTAWIEAVSIILYYFSLNKINWSQLTFNYLDKFMLFNLIFFYFWNFYLDFVVPV